MLTAFVVETYAMLQSDSMFTNNQLLAYDVSSRPGSFPPPPAINATITMLLHSPAYTPTTAARWINSLFFLSLVLSLSAAMFGILAKQWLREYMQWNLPLGSPRQNVLVRQIRVVAWEEWRVPAIIASIPALLELAMVLFVIGLVILLWTLDSTVAIIITIAVSAFLAAASAFTLLPLLYKRCPYKSPTAWACYCFFRVVHAALDPIMQRLLRGRKRLFPFPGYRTLELFSTWRRRDLSSCWIPDHSPLHNAMAEILRLQDSTWNIYSGLSVDEVLSKVTESCLLVSALEWVRQASQDPRVARNVDECTEDGFHRASPARIVLGTPSGRSSALAHRLILWSLSSGGVSIELGASTGAPLRRPPILPSVVVKSALHHLKNHAGSNPDHRVFSAFPPYEHLALLLDQAAAVEIVRDISSLLGRPPSAPYTEDGVHTLYQLVRQLRPDSKWYREALRLILSDRVLWRSVRTDLGYRSPSRYFPIITRACQVMRVSWDHKEGALGQSQLFSNVYSSRMSIARSP